MPFFRKTAIIEAEQFCENRTLPFAGQHVCCLGPEGWYVQTLEGPLRIAEGDWVAKGIRGEFWPIKADIFAETYSPIDAPITVNSYPKHTGEWGSGGRYATAKAYGENAPPVGNRPMAPPPPPPKE